MIIKALDPFQSEDKFLQAGNRAEEKMAFYLSVDFDDAKDIHVLNGVRIELEDGAVQMDHLVIHPWGMIIVESKSVTGKIQIKDDGQWIRWYKDDPSGMESPVTQASIQAKRFRKFLNRMIEPAGFMDQVPVDILVAISDKGVILPPKSGPVANVWKADQIVEKIQAKLELIKKQSKPCLSGQQLEAIGKYLIAIHKPLRIGKIEASDATPELNVAEPKALYLNEIDFSLACKHCRGLKLEIHGGKYGYYFRCLDCGKNTAIQSKCPACGTTEKIHKLGNEFSAECTSCNTSRHYYSNAAPNVVST